MLVYVLDKITMLQFMREDNGWENKSILKNSSLETGEMPEQRKVCKEFKQLLFDSNVNEFAVTMSIRDFGFKVGEICQRSSNKPHSLACGEAFFFVLSKAIMKQVVFV